jgi:hypothetical protein
MFFQNPFYQSPDLLECILPKSILLKSCSTYRSHGRHEREEGEVRAHESVLDHIYVARDLEATVAVLSDSTTDHYPVVAAVKVNKVTPTLKIMKRRKLKAWRGLYSCKR